MATRKDAKAPVTAVKLPVERSHFNLLLATNPNYFGNLADSVFQKGIAKPLVGDTTYEDLACVGFNPQVRYVEAVVQIKLDGGYLTGICDGGSLEYVRFYADFSNNGTWADLGVASVRVHDIAGPKPLFYTLRQTIDPPVPYCGDNPLVKVRAILSWNHEPPPNQPNWPPVWGTVKDVTVQLPTTTFPPLSVLGDLKQVKNLGVLADAIESSSFTIAPKALTLAQKAELYAKSKVPPHRYAFTEVSAAMKSSAAVMPLAAIDTAFSALKTNVIGDLLKAIQVPTHNATEYEEVTCTGYRPEDDNVGAVITVKLSSGYSGDLCHAGSIEYVAFWIDAGGGFQYLGTAGVPVHDLSIPKGETVQYAVSLPVDVSQYLQPCEAGAKVVTLRAVLSWATPPSTTDPDASPYWGNKIDREVQLRPGTPDEATVPRILNISDQTADAATIDPITGLTISGNRPFGQVLAIRAHMGGFPSTSRYYQVRVRRSGTLNWTALTNTVALRVTEFDVSTGNIVDCDPSTVVFNVECFPNVQALPRAGLTGLWYEYQNFTSGSRRRYLVESTVGYWLTTPADEGVWEICVAFVNAGSTTEAVSDTVRVRIDNTGPTVTASLSQTAQQQCGKLTKGNSLTGSYETHDAGTAPNQNDATYQHFAAISVQVLPAMTNGPTVTLDGTGAASRTLGDTGGAGTWEFATTNKTPSCGYVAHFVASDRTIYGWLFGASWGFNVGYTAPWDVGICVE